MYPDTIRELRERKELKQEDIAKLLNTSQQQYSRYETGTEMPYGALRILSKYYNKTIDEIIGNKKNSN